MKKKSFMLVFFIITLATLVACTNSEKKEVSQKNSLEEIQDRGKIILGTDPDYPPFEFYTKLDNQDTLVGVDIELAKYIASELGVDLEIKEMNFSNLLSALTTNQVDFVLAGMNPTKERLKEVNFTNIYYQADFSILVHKDNRDLIKKENDLINKKIGVQLGTTQENIAKDIEESEVESLDSNPDVVMNLKTKKIDFGIMEKPVAESFVQVNKDLEVVNDFTLKDDSSGMAIAVNKDDENLVNKLNEILLEVEKEKLIDDWLIEFHSLSNKELK